MAKTVEDEEESEKCIGRSLDVTERDSTLNAAVLRRVSAGRSADREQKPTVIEASMTTSIIIRQHTVSNLVRDES